MQIHRNGDQRSCGATTIASGQSFVKAGGQLIAVEGDQDTHGHGELIASQHYIKINGKAIIKVNDNANPDDLCPSAGGSHCNPVASSGCSFININ